MTSAIDQRRQMLLRKHTRLAKFYTWLLLLGFVVLPSTFGKIQRPTDSTKDCTQLFNDNRNSLGSTPLYVPSLAPFILQLLIWSKLSPPAPIFLTLLLVL
jgi:hypothetical protein